MMKEDLKDLGLDIRAKHFNMQEIESRVNKT